MEKLTCVPAYVTVPFVGVPNVSVWPEHGNILITSIANIMVAVRIAAVPRKEVEVPVVVVISDIVSSRIVVFNGAEFTGLVSVLYAVGADVTARDAKSLIVFVRNRHLVPASRCGLCLSS